MSEEFHPMFLKTNLVQSTFHELNYKMEKKTVEQNLSPASTTKKNFPSSR